MPIPEKFSDGQFSDGQFAAFYRLIATAADGCRKPFRHAVVGALEAIDDCCVRLEVRDGSGVRFPGDDLELEIYRSGAKLNLTLAWVQYPERPMLWQGNHSVWMDGTTGLRCERPQEGPAVEALARRLRALLVPADSADPA